METELSIDKIKPEEGLISKKPFLIQKANWILFQMATGDTNRLHYDEEYAKKSPFGGVVAPGMYVASLIEGLYGLDVGNLDLRFRDKVFEGDVINISKKENKIIWTKKTKEESIDVIVGRLIGRESENVQIKDVIYENKIDKKNINMFFESIGVEDNGVVPKMYVASLIPATLLRYGDKYEGYKVYLKQSLNFLKDVNFGDTLRFYVNEKEPKGNIHTFLIACLDQEGRLVLEGRALCGEI